MRRQNLLLLISQIITPLDPRLLLTDHLERIVVGDSWKWKLDLLQILSLSLEQSQLRARSLEQLSNYVTQHLLLNLHNAIQDNIRPLPLKIPILRKVPTDPGLFCPEQVADGLHLPDARIAMSVAHLLARPKDPLLAEK